MITPERRIPTTEERAFVKPPEFPDIISLSLAWVRNAVNFVIHGHVLKMLSIK